MRFLAWFFSITLAAKIGSVVIAFWMERNGASGIYQNFGSFINNPIWLWGFTLPFVFMLIYCGVGYLKVKGRNRGELQAYGDSCYYLGFLFTIASIILALTGISEEEFLVSNIALRFAAAMVTTLIGMAIRILIVTFATRKGYPTRLKTLPVPNQENPHNGTYIPTYNFNDYGNGGTAEAAGTDGKDGEAGPEGAAGADGETGPQGAAGSDGENGTAGGRGEDGGRSYGYGADAASAGTGSSAGYGSDSDSRSRGFFSGSGSDSDSRGRGFFSGSGQNVRLYGDEDLDYIIQIGCENLSYLNNNLVAAIESFEKLKDSILNLNGRVSSDLISQIEETKKFHENLQAKTEEFTNALQKKTEEQVAAITGRLGDAVDGIKASCEANSQAFADYVERLKEDVAGATREQLENQKAFASKLTDQTEQEMQKIFEDRNAVFAQSFAKFAGDFDASAQDIKKSFSQVAAGIQNYKPDIDTSEVNQILTRIAKDFESKADAFEASSQKLEKAFEHVATDIQNYKFDIDTSEFNKALTQTAQDFTKHASEFDESAKNLNSAISQITSDVKNYEFSVDMSGLNGALSALTQDIRNFEGNLATIHESILGQSEQFAKANGEGLADVLASIEEAQNRMRQQIASTVKLAESVKTSNSRIEGLMAENAEHLEKALGAQENMLKDALNTNSREAEQAMNSLRTSIADANTSVENLKTVIAQEARSQKHRNGFFSFFWRK